MIALMVRSSEGEDQAIFPLSTSDVQDLTKTTNLAGLDERIGSCLFAGAVRERWAVSTAMAGVASEGVRLRIIVKDEALAGVAWEAAKAGGKWLGLRPQTPIVRYVHAPRPPETLTVDGPLRILVLVGIAGVAGLADLDVMSECRSLDDALQPLINAQLLEISWMDGAITRRDLQHALRQFRPHVLHYIGHGIFDPSTKHSALFLSRAQPDGHTTAYPLSTDDLAILLDGTTVRFAFLNACQTAESISGMAATLVRTGLPAALGMRTDVPDQAAAAFADAFYRALADGWAVDTAVVEGRKLLAMQHGTGSDSWAIPILYMHSHNGVLFEFSPGVLAARDARSASKGFLTMARLARNPGLRAAILASEADLSVACEQIETLRAYNLVHDLFQQLNDLYRLVEEDKKRILTDESAWDSLMLNGTLLMESLDEIVEKTEAASFASDEAVWLGQLRSIKSDMQLSLDSTDYRKLDLALKRLNRVLARVPVHINIRLVGVAQGLRLSAIVHAVQSILDNLPGKEVDQLVITQLHSLTAALVRLNETIRMLAASHNALRSVVDDLRFIQQSLDLDLSQIELLWPDISSIGIRIYGENSVAWAIRLQETHAQLDQALAAGNPTQIRRIVGRYHSQMLGRMIQVSIDLHSVCDELQKIARPLSILLRTL